MTLTDIKNKIEEQLHKLTIDDFYSDPNVNLAKETFAELTNQKSEEEIKNYLTDKFPDAIVKAKRIAIEQTIIDLNNQFAEAQSLINGCQKGIDQLDKQSAEKKERQTNIPKLESQSKDELKEIEIEIQQIRPIANRAPYIKQMEDLEKSKEKKSKEIESYPIELDKLNIEISELKTKTNEAKENLVQIETEIRNIQTNTINAQKELEQLNEEENSFYKDEYSSLEFLFKILLKISISKREVIEYKKTGKKIRYDNYNQTFDEEVELKTGEVKLVFDTCGFREYSNFVLAFTKNKNVIPTGWRKILYQILSNPLPNLSGSIRDVSMSNNKYVYFNSEKLELTNTEFSALLATKIAAKTNYSVKTEDNKIILGLSGGLSATIAFRDKGDLIAKFQKQQFEIYTNCLLSERFVYHTLYFQRGYADSEIGINTPGAFYFIVDKFVIEIVFNAAPILFDNNSIIKFAPNISGKAKHEDEVQAKEEQERRRRDYDDD